MSRPPRQASPVLGVLPAIGALGLLGGALGTIVGVLGAVGLGVLSVLGVVGVLGGAQIAVITVIIRGTKPWSLLWVCCLLPAQEAAGWWELVISCLTEAPDSRERRRHIRSFLRHAPQLIYNSWKLHLDGSLHRARR